MPTLKDLSCSIEVANNQHTLQEFGTTYSDGCVETFVAVPSKPESFSIHLTSDRFIAPGISMYVFVDGVYQCNRNRQDLKLRNGSDSRSVVDFTVRQKEEKQKDGSMVAREWKFDKLDTSSRNAKTTSAMNLDGTSDFRPSPFGLDGQPQVSSPSVYDDRGPYFGAQKYAQAPPAPTYRPPYVESIHGHHTKARSQSNLSPFALPHDQRSHSRASLSFSPGQSLPSQAFQYGSGPIPKGPMHGSERSFYHTRPHSAVVANAPGSDPAWLNEILTKAAKRGVEEYRRDGESVKTKKHRAVDLETASQPPGAWPQSPFAQPAPAPNSVRFIPDEDAGTVWSQPAGGWNPGNADKTKAQVKWDMEPEWDSQSHSGGWAAQEETTSDTWDTDDTWGPKKPTHPAESQWGRSRAASVRSKSELRDASPGTAPTRRSHRSQKDRTRKSRSKSRSERSKWADDHEVRLPIKAPFDSTSSSEASENTARPLRRSGSHSHRSKEGSKSRRKSHRSKSTTRHEGGSSRHLRGGADSRYTSTRARSMSMASNAMPEVIDAPFTTAIPPSTHGPASRSVGFAEPTTAAWVPPAPFSTCGEKSGWGDDNAAGWEDANTAGNFLDDWTVPQNEQDSWEVIDQPNDDKHKKRDSQGWTSGPSKTARTKEPDGGWTTQEDVWATETKPPKATAAVKRIKDDDQGWSPGPNKPKFTKPPSQSKRHTTKSLSKYRSSRPPPSPSAPKPHWQFPPPPTSPPPPPSTILPPEPRLKVPPSTASSKGLSHSVRAGPGSAYGHMISRPSYMDSLEKPYAVFRFKYRSRGVLKELFGEEVRDKGELVEKVKTSKARVQREKEKLEGMGREELVERMVRLKLEGKERDRERNRRREGSRSTESVARGRVGRWVEGQSL